MSEFSLKIKTLSECPEYKTQVLSLIEEEFGYFLPHQYEVDFYPLMKQENSSHQFILLKDDELIGHTALLPKTFMIKDKPERAIFIGGIAFYKKFQGQGLFGQFFKEILSRFHDIPIKVLWSDKHELYKNYGFELGGIQYQYSATGNKNSSKNFDQLTGNEISEIKNLYHKTARLFSHVTRSESDWDAILKIKSAHIIFFKDGETVQGYAIKDKGMDLGGVVHEVCHIDMVKGISQAREYGVVWSPFHLFDEKPEKHGAGLIQVSARLEFILLDPLYIGGVDSV
jgi:predicted N-acetyltransferase YhbS